MPDASQLSRAAFLLAGGKSSRMGTNKAFLNFAGTTLLDRALTTLKSVAIDVTIIGDPATFADSGAVIADLFPGCGPLGGIHAALAHSSADLNLMFAVDMPFVSPELLRFLLSAAEASNTIITVPRTTRGFQPLCAVYRRDFFPIAEANLRGEKYKIDVSFSSIPLRVIEEAELSAAGFSEQSFFNINTPDDRSTAEDLNFPP
ncbi:MAG TPA: molybdenum cofactor guanylyltransferase [Terriglobales bacterium]|nr:molybdenum cofactor guanylyltransferase [Terriglobales bacterium]